MKSTSKNEPLKEFAPLIGSLLRFPREVIVARMFEALVTHGYDITLTELSVFMFPGPDGRRPIDLARQCNMTRQAMNYVLLGLERRGYIEPRDTTTTAARALRLTDKGRDVSDQMRLCVVTIEREWTAYLGVRRFEATRETLTELSRWLGKLA